VYEGPFEEITTFEERGAHGNVMFYPREGERG